MKIQFRKTFFFVPAHPGLGKTTTIAVLAMKYVTGNDVMKQFDFVFTIRLRNVDKTSTLPELIIKQHGQLNKVDNTRIKDILEGKTQHKVALLLDGYDEYKKGRNTEINRAIESGVGNCFIVLTSRPNSVENIREKMDGEITVEGFSANTIVKCSKLFFGNKNERRNMLKTAIGAGIYATHKGPNQKLSSKRMRDDKYLRVPIILLMMCSVSSFLSESDTIELIENEDLCKLGHLAWEALQKDEKQFILNKVGIISGSDSQLVLNCN